MRMPGLNLGPLLTSFVTLGKQAKLSVPQFLTSEMWIHLPVVLTVSKVLRTMPGS